MDRKNAVKLVEKTFGEEFNEDRYLDFVVELFGDSSFLKSPKEYLWKEYSEYAEYLRYYGTYKDSSHKTIDVLSVKLKKNRYRDRSRTMQRNLIAKWLENANKDAAMVAFYGDELDDWRFSFVKMEYKITEDFKIEKGFTPAKRCSFLVGKNEPNHTCKERFLDMVIAEKNPTLEEIEEAFSVENVSDEFFKEYKELFLDLKDELDTLLKCDENIKKEFEEKEISTVDFAKKLLGQIVFIYFLQKKGWLGVQRDLKTGKFKEWGAGPKDFLKRLYAGEYAKYENFFKEILEPLFYEALSTQRDDDYYSPFDCKIPFLNGGLFEPIGGYNWKEINLKLDNGIFEKIFNVFDRYNFTIKEDEPLDKEVAIDPEMLGKVFENLLEIKDRKSKGAFYTPREIVHYMCQQSLINYLETNTNIPREDIEKFIYLSGFSTSEYQRKLIELEKINEQMEKFNNVLSKRYQKLLNERIKLIRNINFPKSILDNIEKVDELLRCVKIADPAVGSGAFPVGIMNEIVKARSILTPFLIAKNSAKMEDRTLYKLKWGAIQNCLYGVDIDSSAVEITKLRFWLSLVVDEDSIDNIRALPNLDHKIMCGNSLLDEFEGIKLFDDSILKIPEEEDKEPEELKKLNIEREDLEKTAKELMLNQNWKELKPVSEKLKELNKCIEKLENKYKKSKNKNENQSQITLSDAINIKRKKSQQKLAELRRLYNEYFNARVKRDKKEYKEKIEKLEWELIEETLIESGNEDALEKLKQYKKSRSKPFFLWKLYFSDVFRRKNPGFDIVIGNPPYVKEYTNKHVFDGLRNSPYYQGKMDLWYFFGCIGLDLLRNNGIECYIAPNNWITNAGASKFRNKILDDTKIIKFIDFGNYKIFKAGIQTMIYILKKSRDEQTYGLEYYKLKNDKISKKELIDFLYGTSKKEDNYDKFTVIINRKEFKNKPITFVNASIGKILEKIKNQGTDKLKNNEIATGIDVHQDFITKKHIEILGNKYNIGDGIFILSNEEKENLNLLPNELELIKPYYTTSELYRYYGNPNNKLWVIYTKSDINNKIQNYPNIKNHLDKFAKIITSDNKPYGLHRARDEKFFKGEKIISLRKCPKPTFTYTDFDCYVSQTYFIIKTSRYNMKYLTTLLNSKLIHFWLNYKGKKQGDLLQIDKAPLLEIPLINISKDQQIPFIEKADKMIELNKKFINKKNEFLKSLNLNKITKKLETFYNLSYKEFLKELKKQKINPTDNLENYFNKCKNELNEIKQEIEKTDKEIDKMVYKLYNLTEEEIKIIENMKNY